MSRMALLGALGVLGCDVGGLDWSDPVAASWTDPADGARDVHRDAELRIGYPRHLTAASVARGRVTLRSGPLTYTLAVRYDPIDRTIVVREFRRRAWEPEVEHELAVEGVRDVFGAEVLTERWRFRTGRLLAPVRPDPEPRWSEVAALFDARCVRCHDASSPAAGLDLSSAEGVRTTLIGVFRGRAGDVRGLRGLPGVHVVAGLGDPGRSYLLYTLIDDAPIVGARMPPGEPLDPGELRLLSDWILAGAPTE